ncbi:gcn5-related n-acetyltransferase [Grosmannia clavigera kw1407]|uniref:Gcn5-related n-acetyltransferase n=1 Tax=Grosmannia clavigera (strain kw1407 / UAMH 11150) TaxID=655863 RepID=F0XFG3_GROCL|nr:gcn5-related n-acetyltransferase [Grosmannia clavigera kw1407]EFX04754.1 gcn5-related n-acetyltransferase [Grosmannia clavigera kw1407]
MLFSQPMSINSSAFIGRIPPFTLLSLLPQKPTILSANETDALHHMAVMELDLTACHPSSLVDRLNAMPALKTSAAFFTFLRANLAIPPTEMASAFSTPLMEPTKHISLPAVVGKDVRSKNDISGSAGAAKSSRGFTTAAATSLDDIPPLSLGILTTRADKVDALKLVTDSIAQQRQVASRSLVFHPLNLTGFAVALGIAYQLTAHRDLGTQMTLLSGITMTYLLGIRFWSSKYIYIAEALGWDWLQGNTGGSQVAAEDTVIGARYGEEMIGALVLHMEPSAPSQAVSSMAAASTDPVPASRKKTRSSNNSSSGNAHHLKGGHGVIRAWTTKLRYRRRGIGGDLLAEAVRVTWERCGKDAVVGFAKEHANSSLVLPGLYNGPFRANGRLAIQTLEKVQADMDGSKRKR